MQMTLVYYIGLPDEIYKKVDWYCYPILKSIFLLFCGVTLRQHYVMVSNIKNLHSVLEQC